MMGLYLVLMKENPTNFSSTINEDEENEFVWATACNNDDDDDELFGGGEAKQSFQKFPPAFLTNKCLQCRITNSDPEHS